MTAPPGNSLEQDQRARVADEGATLVDGLAALLERIQEEIGYNDAKGQSAFRLGVHDGLRFAEDAIVELLTRHGHTAESQPTEFDA
ncbi:MAG: hypothetical protein QNJ88_00270 [Acidimicrobiia bacterium]|nr:hypothetical protein [Acidimicrobiia bacterium]